MYARNGILCSPEDLIMTKKRELIEPNPGDNRYVRRDEINIDGRSRNPKAEMTLLILTSCHIHLQTREYTFTLPI